MNSAIISCGSASSSPFIWSSLSSASFMATSFLASIYSHSTQQSLNVMLINALLTIWDSWAGIDEATAVSLQGKPNMGYKVLMINAARLWSVWIIVRYEDNEEITLPENIVLRNILLSSYGRLEVKVAKMAKVYDNKSTSGSLTTTSPTLPYQLKAHPLYLLARTQQLDIKNRIKIISA